MSSRSLLHGSHNGQLETVGGMLAPSTIGRRISQGIVGGCSRRGLGRTGQSSSRQRCRRSRTRLEYPIGKVLYQSGGWISNIRFSPLADRIAFMDHPGLWDNRLGPCCVVDLAWGTYGGLTEESGSLRRDLHGTRTERKSGLQPSRKRNKP